MAAGWRAEVLSGRYSDAVSSRAQRGIQAPAIDPSASPRDDTKTVGFVIDAHNPAGGHWRTEAIGETAMNAFVTVFYDWSRAIASLFTWAAPLAVRIVVGVVFAQTGWLKL